MGGGVEGWREGEIKKEHTTEGPEELQTDTSLLIYTVYVCVCLDS